MLVLFGVKGVILRCRIYIWFGLVKLVKNNYEVLCFIVFSRITRRSGFEVLLRVKLFVMFWVYYLKNYKKVYVVVIISFFDCVLFVFC